MNQESERMHYNRRYTEYSWKTKKKSDEWVEDEEDVHG